MRIYSSSRYRRLRFFLRLRQNFLVRAMLWPFALGYGVATVMRLWLRLHVLPRHRLSVTTISIGNISSGGSGKTPVTIAIAQQLLLQGERVAVLSRGYGSSLRRHEYVVLRGGKVVGGKVSVRHLDEPLMLSQALPQAVVIAAGRRFAAWQAYLAQVRDELPTCVLLDDGFQHVQIVRDFDIVLLDAARPFADGRLLPCGMLREAVRSLRRADLVLFTRATDDVPSAINIQRVQHYVPYTSQVQFSTPRLLPVSNTRVDFGMDMCPVLLICGVAEPARVLEALRELDVPVHSVIYLADHEPVDRAMVLRLARRVRAIVLTAKDYWRDSDFYAQQLLPVFMVELVVDFDFSEWQKLR